MQHYCLPQQADGTLSFPAGENPERINAGRITQTLR